MRRNPPPLIINVDGGLFALSTPPLPQIFLSFFSADFSSKKADFYLSFFAVSIYPSRTAYIKR